MQIYRFITSWETSQGNLNQERRCNLKSVKLSLSLALIAGVWGDGGVWTRKLVFFYQISCLLLSYMHVICFDQIDLPFCPLEFLPYLSATSLPNFMCSSLPSLSLLSVACVFMGIGPSTQAWDTSQGLCLWTSVLSSTYFPSFPSIFPLFHLPFHPPQIVVG